MDLLLATPISVLATALKRLKILELKSLMKYETSDDTVNCIIIKKKFSTTVQEWYFQRDLHFENTILL